MIELELRDALKALQEDGFTTGPNWKHCHDLCAQNEGKPGYDWVHALVHRIEGDEFNAKYWYRKADQPPHKGTILQEWQEMVDALSTDE